MTLLPALGAATPAPPLSGGPAPGVPSGLVLLARAEWPAAADDTLPDIPGFIMSSFSPLVVEVAQRCLRRYFGAPPADQVRAERIAVVLASGTGDLGTSVAIARAVDEGRRVPPLLFYQSNPNAVVGYLTARWGLGGPVICTIPAGEVLADACDCAALLVEDGDADAVLIIVAGQARSEGERDRGEALLAGPPGWVRADGLPNTS